MPTETVPAGLLPHISDGLTVSEAVSTLPRVSFAVFAPALVLAITARRTAFPAPGAAPAADSLRENV